MRHIEIGGKKRPVHYSINALIEFEEITEIEIQSGANVEQLRKLKNIRTLAFIGLKHGAQNAGGTVDFTEEEVGNWIGFNDGTADKILEAFSKEQGADDVSDTSVDEADESEKKN